MAVTKSERTRQFIIEKTAPLFNTKGFEATSLSDLTEATGLTKGAIYGNFENKEEIAVAAFRYAMEKTRAMIRERVSTGVSNREKLVLLFEFYAAYVNNPPVPGGCPILNNAVEADDFHTSMRRVVVKEMTKTIEYIQGLLEDGVAQGEFKKSTDARMMAYVFFCVIEGGIMYSRAERSPDAMELVVKHCKQLIDQITKS